MPVESAADRLAFLDLADFGVEAAYTPAAGGGATAITGILDNPSARSGVFDQVPTATSRPTFCCREGDLPVGAASDAGDEIVIDGTTWKVSMIDPDGQGMALLTLYAAS